jgi:dTDP-6-deoxy-L-talose 4-dehydrogenase (NAD+)
MMKIAVTGATGFIGRHVLSHLRKHTVDVTAVIRPSSTKASMLQDETVIALDMHNPPANAFELMGCPDVLIHLAWDGLPNYGSLHHYETELPSQYRFLKSLVGAGLPAMVVAGTCFEYGMQSGPLSVDCEARPANPYGYAKDALRRQLQFLRDQTPFALTWTRLFYLYGEGQSETSLFSQLKCAVERGDPVFNMSGGEQLRDYLDVAEAARRIINLALGDGNQHIVNVCSGKPISVRRLVETWIKDQGWSIQLNLGHYPYPTYEPMAFWGVNRDGS